MSLSDASVVVWDTTPWQKQIAERVAREVPADLTPLWDALAGDAATGLRAARLLAAAGDRAVIFLEGKCSPKPAPDAAAIKRQIAALDSPDFATREKAEKGLRESSARAELYLREAIGANPSPEVRQRVEGLLKGIEGRKLTPAEAREVRAVQTLVWAGTDAARALLAKWAGGDPAATLTKAAAAAR